MKHKITTLLGCVLLALGVSGQTPNIVAFEYWFDQNDAERTYVPVPPGATVNFTNAQLNTTGLSLGQHQACMRWKDQPAMGQARWSSVVCRALNVGLPGPWEIIAVRYWVGNPTNDADPAIRYLYFDTLQTQVDFNGMLELCGYPTGQQWLRLQLLDNHGQWSSVVTSPMNIIATSNMAITSITASVPQLCNGDTVLFTAQPVIAPDHALPTHFVWTFPSDWEVQPSDSVTVEVIVGDSLGEIAVRGSNYCGQIDSASLMVTDVTCTVGVAGRNDQLGEPMVFPNPSNGTFRISMQEGYGPPELIVLDLLGRQLLPKIGPTADGQLEIDLRNEASGTYLLRMRVQDDWMVVPIVLVR